MGPASASEWNSHSEHGRGQRARGADSRRAGCEIASSFPAVGAATPCSEGAAHPISNRMGSLPDLPSPGPGRPVAVGVLRASQKRPSMCFSGWTIPQEKVLSSLCTTGV